MSPVAFFRPHAASLKNGRTAVFHGEAARRVAHEDVRHEKTQPQHLPVRPTDKEGKQCAMIRMTKLPSAAS